MPASRVHHASAPITRKGQVPGYYWSNDGATIFRTPFAGSVAPLYVLALLFIAANLALGLVFSTFAQT